MALDPAVNQETGASGRRYRGNTLTCERVEFGAITTPALSKWTSNNYITRCHRRLELVGVRVAVWGSENQLQTEGCWAAVSAAIVRGTLGQYVAVCSVSNLPLKYNQYQPFRNPCENKVWELIFLKNCVRSFIIADYVSACICIRTVVSWLYTIKLIWYVHGKIWIGNLFTFENNFEMVQRLKEMTIYQNYWNIHVRNIMNIAINTNVFL